MISNINPQGAGRANNPPGDIQMNAQDAAAKLDGAEYPRIGTRELFAEMKVAGLVAVFGGSDDNMEFRGTWHDEFGCYGGGTAYVNEYGLYTPQCHNEDCPHERTQRAYCRTIEALWCETEDAAWTYKTDIPHATFKVMEDDEIYCVGIVFAAEDAA